MSVQPKTMSIPLETVAAVKKFACYPIPHMNALKVTQPFGVNFASFYASMGLIGHNGYDIRMGSGTRLYACFDGQVTFAGMDSTGGVFIELATNGFTIPGYEGSYRLRTIYYHLQDYKVNNNDWVKAGEYICDSDNTGKYTSGPHLHWGLKIDKKTHDGWATLDKDNGYLGAVDPEPFFPDALYQIVPVDTQYGLGTSIVAEAYKVAVTPWLKMKLKRQPTPRELNAFAYGHWSFETVQDETQFTYWTQMTKAQFSSVSGQSVGL